MRYLRKLHTNYVALRYLLSMEKGNKGNFFTRLKWILKGFSSEKQRIYNLNTNNYKDYLSDFNRRKTERINNKYTIIINDKDLFAKLLKNSGLIAESYGYIKQGMITLYSNDTNLDEFITLIRTEETIIVKKNSGGGGKGIYKISYIESDFYLNNEIISIDELSNFIKGLKDYVIQEHLKQADYSNKIYGGTINTIRILVMRDPKTKKAFIATAVHKFGSEKTKPADNVSKGGMTALVDLETGTLQKSAYHQNANKDITWRDLHPDTNEIIKGVQIPHWNKVKDTILNLTDELHYLNYVGWDVVVTNDGLKIIEGNNYSDVNILQIHKPLLLNDKVVSFYKHHKIIK